ncbi:MAG: type VI secretion system baseplate subunit TssE [Gammaproteobacteria bacterium]|nr:type VI secretion system baseplate subunit TssE [Gammaproteobacteria bacterium]MDH5802709.1 type VI secretion system baseplate subunit TssE [Gammaproteobacteria bacterium]
MAELSQKERLQPSLLDRLTDRDPERKAESRTERVLSLQQLRKSVIRDIGWLLNTDNLSLGQEQEDYPELTHSVLNYGMPDMSGTSVSNLDSEALVANIKQAIIDFEPRILKNTIRINLVVDDEKMNNKAVSFEIEGELWAQPTPLRVYLKTELDLETGNIDVSDSVGVR